MKYEDIDTGISQEPIDMDQDCPECGERGVTGNGVCLSCLVKIARNEPMQSVQGRLAQIKILETQEKTRSKIMSEVKKGEPTGEVSSERLRSFILRIEKLNEQKESILEDLRDAYGESKSVGFDPRIIRKIVAMRKKEVEKLREEEELLDLYKSALGMP